MGHQPLNLFFDHLLDAGADVVGPQDFAAHGIDGPAVAVHDIVVLDYILAGIEVEAFDFLLGALQAFADHLAFDWRIVIDFQSVHYSGDTLTAVNPHQVVLAGNVELGLARLALAAGPAAQLVVDPARFMALATQ